MSTGTRWSLGVVYCFSDKTSSVQHHRHPHHKHVRTSAAFICKTTEPATALSPLELGESTFLLMEYFVEYLIEYSSTHLIPEVHVAINYVAIQN